MSHMSILDQSRFSLAATVAGRVAGRRTADPVTRRAVAVLTASADPARADRLAPRPDEPAPLVERLAVWALPRASDDAVAHATCILADPQPSGADATSAPEPAAVPVLTSSAGV